MKVTLQLIDLQTYVLSKGYSIIGDNRKYKSTPEVLYILNNIYKTIDEDEHRYLGRLVAGTTYKIKFE